jgi:hypothetical protein
MTIKVGDKLPETTFSYVPWGPELDDAVCPPLSLLRPALTPRARRWRAASRRS